IPTLGELADEFLVNSAAECRDKVHRTNISRIKNLLNHFGADRLATSISRDDITEYRRERLKIVKAVTVNKEIIKLGQILDIALRKKAVTENPARGLDRLRDRRDRIPRSLTDGELATLLSKARESNGWLHGRLYDMIVMYLFTGMRRAELLWLEWDDVDLEHRQIVVQGKESWNTKTGKFRVVGMAHKIVSLLQQMPRNGRFVFGSGDDTPLINHESMTRSFGKIRKRSGLSDQITLHSLRHTYITHLLRAGVYIRRVKELAGHGDIKTTMKYAHALPTNEIYEDRLYNGTTIEIEKL
ncbi:MAG: site-specific integrase, partial [Deltaproteobacteria bacterium]|nr:site-specific integrase [Deltaproteobacteria bacterium]